MLTIMQNTRAGSHRTGLRPGLIALAALVLLLAGCNREERAETRSAEELYVDARAALDGRNFPTAIDRYRRLTTLYPFGRHAEQAQLDMAYAMQQARQPEQALTTLDRFIRTYPTHPNIDYAWYLKGLVHYDETMGMLRRLFPGQVVDRDQDSARRAFQDFQQLIQRYPQSRYVADARQRMVFLRNVLAEYEITVGEYYFRRKAYIASVDRARFVIENYQGAPANVNALDLLSRAYEKMDLPELAADTRRVLELNYAEELDQLEQQQPGWLSRLWPFD